MNSFQHIILSVLCLFLWNLCLGQTDSVKNELTILEYGFPPDKLYLNARYTISNKWGFQFTSVAGCIVTGELIDSVREHNAGVYPRLIDSFGEDWKARFDAEVDDELQVQKRARQLIDQQPYILQLDSLLHTKGNGLLYFLYPTPINGGYSAIVNGWGDWNGKSELLIYYKLTIHLADEEVVIDSDKPELFEGI